MPYKRYQRKVPTNKQLDKKIRNIVNDQELKYKDNQFSVTNENMRWTMGPPALTPLSFYVSNPGIGSDERARDGDIIRGTSLKLDVISIVFYNRFGDKLVYRLIYAML